MKYNVGDKVLTKDGRVALIYYWTRDYSQLIFREDGNIEYFSCEDFYPYSSLMAELI